MIEETAKRKDNASADDGIHPCIIVVGQSPKIVDALRPECFWRRWVPLVVNDLDTALEAIDCRAPSAVVVPLSIADVADGRFCSKVRERHPNTLCLSSRTPTVSDPLVSSRGLPDATRLCRTAPAPPGCAGRSRRC